MIYYIKNILYYIALLTTMNSKVLASSSFFYRDLDKLLEDREISFIFLPSQRAINTQSVFTIFEMTNLAKRTQRIPTHPRIYTFRNLGSKVFPTEYLSSLIQHLFPDICEGRHVANQIVGDPIATLDSKQIGALIHAINIFEDAGKISPHFAPGLTTSQEKINILAKIIKLDLKAEIFANVASDIFNRQDMVEALASSVHTSFEDGSIDQCYDSDSDSEADCDEREIYSRVKAGETEDSLSRTKAIKSIKLCSPFRLSDFMFFQDRQLMVDNKIEYEALEKYAQRSEYSPAELSKLRQRKFINVLMEAIDYQSNQPFLRGSQIVQKTLATYFWQKAKTIKDIARFYSGLSGLEITISSDIVQKIPAADFIPLAAQLNTSPNEFFALDPETRAFLIWNERNRGSFHPVFFATTVFQTFCYSDCVETTARNTISRAIRAINKDGMVFYDASLLPPGAPARRLFELPETQEPEFYFSPEARKAWSEILSNHADTGIVYCKKRNNVHYEVQTGIINFLNVIKYLLNIPDDHYPVLVFNADVGVHIAQALGIVSEYLSHPESQLILRADLDELQANLMRQDFFGEIQLTINDIELAQLSFTTTHGNYNPSQTAATTDLATKIIKESRSCQQALQVLPLVSSVSDLQHILPFIPEQQRWSAFSVLDLSDLEIKLAILKNCLETRGANFRFAINLLQSIARLEDYGASNHTWDVVKPFLIAEDNSLLDPKQKNELIIASSRLFTDCWADPVVICATNDLKEEWLDLLAPEIKSLRVDTDSSFKMIKAKLHLFQNLNNIVVDLPRMEHCQDLEAFIPFLNELRIASTAPEDYADLTEILLRCKKLEKLGLNDVENDREHPLTRGISSLKIKRIDLYIYAKTVGEFNPHLICALPVSLKEMQFQIVMEWQMKEADIVELNAAVVSTFLRHHPTKLIHKIVFPLD